LIATLVGHLTGDDGRESATEFRQALQAGPVHAIWDLRSMSGCDSQARDAWQNTIWPLRKSIRSLTVVGGNALVRVGAVFLAALLGVPWSMRDTPEEQERAS
jgi:hypothetical protein